MRWVVFAFVVACSPKENPEDKRVPPKQPRFAIDAMVPTYSDDPPWDAIEIDAPTVETGPVTIRPPGLAGAPLPAGILAVARVANGYRKVDVATLTVTGDTVAIPAGEAIEIADIARAATPAGVLVIAPATSMIDHDLGFALANECWTFATIDGNALVATWPKPCPAMLPDGKDLPQVAFAIGAIDQTLGSALGSAQHELGVTSPRELVSGTLEPVIEKLRTIKTSKPFAKRSDILITTHSDVTLAAYLPVLAKIHETGFTGTRWVPPVWIPVRLDETIGFEPPPPPIGGLMQPGPPRPPRQVIVTIADAKLPPNAAYTPDEIGRVMRARIGVFRACYQKELNRTPGIQGTLAWSVLIEPDGTVSTANSTGSLRNGAVVQCVTANIQRLKFPPKAAKTNFKTMMTFASA